MKVNSLELKPHTLELAAIVLDGVYQQIDETLEVIKRHCPRGSALCNDRQAVQYLSQILEHLQRQGIGKTIESLTHASHSVGIAMEYTKTLLRLAGNSINRSFSNPLSMQPEGQPVLQWLKGIWLRLRGISRQLLQLVQDYFQIDQWKVRGKFGSHMLGLSDVNLDVTFNTGNKKPSRKGVIAELKIDDDEETDLISAENREDRTIEKA